MKSHTNVMCVVVGSMTQIPYKYIAGYTQVKNHTNVMFVIKDLMLQVPYKDIRICTRDEPYKCDMCSKGFSNQVTSYKHTY